MPPIKKTPQERACDSASIEALAKAERDGVSTCFSRMDTQSNQCKFGTQGVCCRICHMGPCRITAASPLGVCGANVDTIVARNFLREAAGGASAHSDHGRHLVLLLKKVAEGKGGDYSIHDEAALRRNARLWNVAETGRATADVAFDLADRFLKEFASQESPLATTDLAPAPRRETWKKQGVTPLGVDRMVVEAMHRSTMGVDHDWKHLLFSAFQVSLADGWGGSRIASATTDILFGTPMPVKSEANLGVLREDTVNVVVHGHEPALSEILAIASRDPAILSAARAAGATGGVTLAGICCTANEILMRHGIPVAGNFLQQELAVVTGAVELLLVDIQCCMPSLPEVAASYHTEVVSTAHIAKTVGVTHIVFDEDKALDSAKALLLRAIANFKNRDPRKLAIPKSKSPLIAGFSVEAIKYMLGGTFRGSFRPLNDAIISGRIRGVVGIVGCSNPKFQLDSYTNRLTRELLKNNILILKTGCAALASAKEGLLTPEASLQAAGAGLREVCEAIGTPPVLHMGSCVDNARILEAATEVVQEGGLGDDLSQVPAVGAAPEWMSEKAVSIGCYFVASGIDVVLGHPFHVGGSPEVDRYLTGGASADFGASFHVCPDPLEAAAKITALIEAKRDKLGINQKQERKLYDMKDRRGIVV